MTRRLFSIFVVSLAASLALGAAQPDERVAIRVDAASNRGPMAPFWAFFGYDEPNYTYMRDGTVLLSELAELSPVPVFVRAHNLLTTGDGTPALKWGSTNAYTEDAAGTPRYDWTIVDRILDTYVQRKMKPLLEIGFMPEALSSHPTPYRHFWKPGDNYNDIYTGWSYPPNDYAKWGELVHQLTRHVVSKYGKAEVESWLFEVWNEPDIGYWHGTSEEYQKLYDFAADGLKRALPTAKIGGPHVTAPSNPRPARMLREFLEHTLRGTNFATGKVGSPVDYIGFHAKGQPRVVEGHVRMGVSNQLRAIAAGFEIVASFPEYRQTPIIIGESDPEGCAACSVRTNPENAYRNGTMYSSYTAEQIARTYELVDRHGVNLRGSVTWAFEFEDQPYFAGFRDLATNGIDKPVLNVFRMFGRMGGTRLAVESSGALALDAVQTDGVRARPDVNAMASRAGRSVAVLVWNYHDDDLPAPAAAVDLAISALPKGNVTVTEYRVDADHGNAYEAWKRMGEPQPPTAQQITTLKNAARFVPAAPSSRATVSDGTLTRRLTVPRQGVTLVTVTW
ncbi:MAG: beta-xylosidase [Vicinamibacterales bacterium]